jgi:hypothetical protein
MSFCYRFRSVFRSLATIFAFVASTALFQHHVVLLLTTVDYKRANKPAEQNNLPSQRLVQG